LDTSETPSTSANSSAISSTGYPGASPEDVEQNITNPIEDELSSVIGIEKFSSISRQGSSVILVTLSPDVDDVSALKQDIQNAVDRIKSLPDEVVNLPEVVDMKSSLQSILKVNISSNSLSFAQLRNKIDEIADELALVDGVSEVSKEGYLDREIQIRIDTDKLYQYKLSLPPEDPWREIELNFSIPITLLNSSSIGLVIFCSTSSGEAPG
jgi:multidrug efflux pump subunit AcrB